LTVTMLSNIGRAAIRRVGAGTSDLSTNRALQKIWLFQQVTISNDSKNASNRPQFSFSLRRSYVTASKGTQTAKPRAKKSTTTAKSKTAKKTSPKKAAKKPKKKAAAKPKAKRSVKKVLTEAQKEKAAEVEAKAQIKDLKAKALLSPPKGKPATAWNLVLSELSAADTSSVKISIPEIAKEAAVKYKSLSPEELEHYNHIANQNKAANNIALKQWIESHTPAQIYDANNARHLLKKKTATGHGKYTSITDMRIPKRRRSPLVLFTQSRWASGDLKGLKIADASPIITREWKALSASERKLFEDQSSADKRRYEQEYKTTFHRDPPYVTKAVAAARLIAQ